MEFINFYLSLELYTFSSIILILVKENKKTSKISIIYFIFNAISTILIIIGICYIYKIIGVFNIIDIENIYKYFQYLLIDHIKNETMYLKYIILNPINIIILGIIFKLGSAPFHYIIYILYDSIPTIITLYQSIFPKIIYCFILFNFIYLINNLTMIYIYIILSLICGSLLGLNNKKIKKLLASSTIVNIGFLLLGVVNSYNFNLISLPNNNDISLSNIVQYNYDIPIGLYNINIIHYLIIYLLNVVNIFYILLLFNNLAQENIKYLKYLYNLYPFISFYFLISIASLIGIPPFAGFYAKLFIFYNSFLTFNIYIYYIIIIAILATLISCVYYLYFIKYIFNNSTYIYNSIYLIKTEPNIISYTLTLTTLFIIFFPFISYYFITIIKLYLI